MRLAVIDVGNTSTAVGLWVDGRVSRVRHFDGGALDWDGWKAWGRLDGFAYVSVVPREDAAWKRKVRAAGLRFHQVSFRDFHCANARTAVAATGFALDYPHPETIGADRLADAAGALARYGAPVLVMDFGTALTAAIVTRDRVWRGGVIAPGFPLMRDYLFERTAKLPRMKLGVGRLPRIGRSTEEAMRFGVIVGYRGMVREIVRELERNFHERFRRVATGGFARWALKDAGLDVTIDPTLTLYGAGLVAAEKLVI